MGRRGSGMQAADVNEFQRRRFRQSVTASMGEFAHAKGLGNVVATAEEIKQNEEEAAEWLSIRASGTEEEKLSTYNHRVGKGSSSFLTDDFNDDELKHIILPMGSRRGAWDLLTLALVVYTAVTLPYVICFLPAEEDVPTLMQVLDFLIDIVFIADIVINFHTAYGAALTTARCRTPPPARCCWLVVPSPPIPAPSVRVSAADRPLLTPVRSRAPPPLLSHVGRTARGR